MPIDHVHVFVNLIHSQLLSDCVVKLSFSASGTASVAERILFLQNSSTMALLAVLLVLVGFFADGAVGQPKVPALFVFGDSTLDAGNNNVIGSPVRADFPPYGRDFPGGIATGRFSNGKLTSDFLASSLGIKDTVPAYLDPRITEQDLRSGVTFASSGAGYDDFTSLTAKALTLAQQVDKFNEYRARLVRIAGAVEAQRIVGESIYLLGSGSADISVSFYHDRAAAGSGQRGADFTIDGYLDFLINNGLQILTKLYNAGAKKMLVSGLSILGCAPSERTSLVTQGRPCNETLNQAARSFNERFPASLAKLQSSLAGSTIVFFDTYSILANFVLNPINYGFLEVTRGCCGSGLFEIGTSCRDALFTCPNADYFVYWDTVHPSQKAYQLVAEAIAQGDLTRLV